MRNLDGHVTIGNLENQVFDLFALDGPNHDVFDPSSTVMGIDNGVANFEIQCSVPLSSMASLTRAPQTAQTTVQVKAMMAARPRRLGR